MKRVVLLAASLAILGLGGCSKSSSNATLKSADTGKAALPRPEGGAKDKSSTSSAPSVIK